MMSATLYTGSDCAPCDGARNLLVNRGIPFVASHPDTPVAQGIFNLVQTIVGGEAQAPTEARGVVGKLRRMFG